MNNLRKFICTLIAIMVIFSITGCSELEESTETSVVTDENKLEKLEDLGIKLYDLDLVKGEVPEMEKTAETKTETVNYEMPDISEYEPFVTGSGEVEVEIFLPTEENGSSIQEVMRHLGESFNKAEFKTDDGKTESVRLRALESALAEDFIESGAYIPNGYIAANELYGALMESYGIESNMISNKLIGNTMGLAIIQEKFDELFSDSKKITSKDIVEANLERKLKIGYPNPIKSPTGLNFVVSMLSGLDEANPNSIEATTDFAEFQGKARVFYSTDQMLKAAEKGEINALVMEHQAFESKKMGDQYVFIPFGMRQDYPMYEMSNNTDEENGVLIDFAQFCKENTDSTDFGFNKDSEYISSVSLENYPVGTISEILDFWKKNKAGGKQIVAVFVADISGSMKYYNKKENLAKSLKDSMKYINDEAKIGLIIYHHEVFNALPIGTFNQSQMEYFSGAVDRVAKGSNGGTSTNNALMMAIKMLYEYEEENKNKEEIKPVIILLSDGVQESGYSLEKVRNIIKAFGYPIYTIGYGEDSDVEELQDIADINGGVYIDSSTDDVGYQIATLFNAEM